MLNPYAESSVPMTDRIAFYVNLLADVEVRNNINTADKAQRLIDSMEDQIEHEDLPSCYDWLVARRNRFESLSTTIVKKA